MAVADEIARAVEILRSGGLVAFPTETVYGLGADAANEAAVRRLFAAKGRPADHPVIVHLADAARLSQWASGVPEAARLLAAAFWPGPLTLIVRREAGVLDVVTGGQETVGVRVPRHPVAHALLTAFGGGVAAPSANRFGHISPTRAAHVRAEFDAATVPLVLDGDPPEIGVESTIVDVSGARPTLLRPGGITPAQLAAALGEPVAAPTAHSPRVSGSLPRHYAPRTPLEIVPTEVLEQRVRSLRESGERVAVLFWSPRFQRHVPQAEAVRDEEATYGDCEGGHYLKVVHGENRGGIFPRWISGTEDSHRYARMLYTALRGLDNADGTRILVEDVPEGDEWLAVRDRLRRAAQAS